MSEPGTPDVARMLDALRRGVDPGLLRGVGTALSDPDEAPVDRPDAPPSPAPGHAVDAAPDPATAAARPESRFDVSALLARAGVPRLAARVDVSSWGPEFWSRLQALRHHAPPNWPAPLDLAAAAEVVDVDGLPLVWVPRADVVEAVVAARGRAQRAAVLAARASSAVHDGRAVLEEVAHPLLAEHRRLAGLALDALDAGHPEAAQALAVAVAGSAVTACLRGPHAQVQQQVLLDPDLAAYGEWRLRAALLPVLRLTPGPVPDPAGPPEQDAAALQDAARAEAVVAVLVACSALRGLQELRDVVETAR